ncbi:unnamed protein product [Agarophyton chilense]
MTEIPQNVTQDNGPLTMEILNAQHFQQYLLGINQNTAACMRTDKSMGQLQQLCFESGKAVATVLGSPVNTKLYRIIYHISDYINDYGFVRKGDRDEIKTLHEHTKEVFVSTKHYLHELVPQLLNARVYFNLYEDVVQRGDDV